MSDPQPVEEPGEKRSRWTGHIPLDDVLPALTNSKNHATEIIAAGIDAHGLIEIPAVDERTGRLISGHGRLADALARRDAGQPPPDGIDIDAEGRWLLPVERGWRSENDEQARAAGIVLNRSTIAGGFDNAELYAELDKLDDVAAAGYTDEEVTALFAEVSGFPTLPGTSIPAARLAAIDSLRPHPRNYQSHPDDQVDHLATSIEQFSFFKNVVTARDDTILAGHGAWRAAQQAGLDLIPAVRLDLDPDSPEALKIIALDNEIGRFAERDDRSLTELLREVRDGDPFGLAGTGYDDAILAALTMMTRPASEIRDFDAAAEWVGLPDYTPGEPTIRFVINFETTEARQRFIDSCFEEGTVSRRLNDSTWSGHWPKRTVPREGNAMQWVEA